MGLERSVVSGFVLVGVASSPAKGLSMEAITSESATAAAFSISSALSLASWCLCVECFRRRTRFMNWDVCLKVKESPCDGNSSKGETGSKSWFLAAFFLTDDDGDEDEG